MYKCCSCVIVLWCCLGGFESGWSPDSSCHLRSCDTTTLGSPTVPSFSKGLSTCDLNLATPNVNDGVYCLSSGNYVPGESEASPNVDINVFTKTLLLKIKHIYFLFLLITYDIFYKKSKGFNKVLRTWAYSRTLTIFYKLLFTNFFSYGLTHAIFFPFLACNFSLRIFLDSHKSNSSSCLGLQVISKSQPRVKHNDSCLWSSWYCFNAMACLS